MQTTSFKYEKLDNSRIRVTQTTTSIDIIDYTLDELLRVYNTAVKEEQERQNARDNTFIIFKGHIDACNSLGISISKLTPVALSDSIINNTKIQ